MVLWLSAKVSSQNWGAGHPLAQQKWAICENVLHENHIFHQSAKENMENEENIRNHYLGFYYIFMTAYITPNGVRVILGTPDHPQQNSWSPRALYMVHGTVNSPPHHNWFPPTSLFEAINVNYTSVQSTTEWDSLLKMFKLSLHVTRIHCVDSQISCRLDPVLLARLREKS